MKIGRYGKSVLPQPHGVGVPPESHNKNRSGSSDFHYHLHKRRSKCDELYIIGQMGTN